MGESFVAKKAGDETLAEEPESPLQYIDFFGLLCAIFMGLGWGKSIQFNPHTIIGRYRLWRVVMVYMARPFFSFMIALSSLLACVFLIGPQSLRFAFWNLFSRTVLLQQLSAAFPEYSSMTLVIVFILLSLVTLNTFLVVWNIINHSFHYILFIGAERGYDYMKYAEALAIFGPLVILVFFTGPLRFFLTKGIVHAAYSIAACCGVC